MAIRVLQSFEASTESLVYHIRFAISDFLYQDCEPKGLYIKGSTRGFEAYYPGGIYDSDNERLYMHSHYFRHLESLAFKSEIERIFSSNQ